MSILQDLDPKYAKIHTQPSFAGWKPIAWILSLLLFLLWVSWLVFTTQFDKGVSEKTLPGDTTQEHVSISTEVAKLPTGNPSQVAATGPTDAPPAIASTGSAIIQETSEQESAKSEKSPDSIPFRSITPEAKKLANSDQATKPDTKEQSAHKKARKSAVHTAERKPVNRQANKAYAKKNSQPTTKNATERDIDIITAIVR